MSGDNKLAFAAASQYRYQPGLTKREYFVAAAMQALLIAEDYEHLIPAHAVEMADRVLDELDKEAAP